MQSHERAIRTALWRSLLLVSICTAVWAQEEPIIPDNIKKAYEDMRLSETQSSDFDSIMLKTIEDVKSMINMELLKQRWPLDRRIHTKARRLFSAADEKIAKVLQPEQMDPYQIYAHLVLDVLTSRNPKDYEGVAFGPVIGVIER